MSDITTAVTATTVIDQEVHFAPASVPKAAFAGQHHGRSDKESDGTKEKCIQRTTLKTKRLFIVPANALKSGRYPRNRPIKAESMGEWCRIVRHLGSGIRRAGHLSSGAWSPVANRDGILWVRKRWQTLTELL